MLFWNPRLNLPVPEHASKLENQRNAEKCIMKPLHLSDVSVYTQNRAWMAQQSVSRR